MIITCPDCKLMVSDKAHSCPHCGFPMKEQPRTQQRKKKRMRLPNGFGQISEIKNQNLREPFRVMVTVGTDEDTGRPIVELLKPKAYFKTYNEAYQALVEYHKTPYEKSMEKTMDDLYNDWFEEYQSKVVPATWTQVKSLWPRLEAIHKMRVTDVHVPDIKNAMAKAEASPIVNRKIKNLFNMLFDYAVENEIVPENVSRKFSIETTKASEEAHITFTAEEISKMWKKTDDDYVAYMLIGCYTGWRPDELLNIKLTDIVDGYMVGGSKTDAGKNRVVPVHSAISEIVSRFSSDHKEYLCEESGKQISYRKYHDRFSYVIKDLGLNSAHKPHDTRVTFVTMMKEANADEYALKRIVGHAISDVTEKVYSKRGKEWLKEEIEKLRDPENITNMEE